MAEREEDKAMAGLLRRSLAQEASGGSGETCPDPEILAAYFDRALDAQETALYELHFSRCAICREQLAAMLRAGGDDAVERKTAGGWRWLAGPGWLMPAAAMVVALLVAGGIALRNRKPVESTNQIAMSRPDAPPLATSAPPTNSAPSPKVAPSSDAALPATRAMNNVAAPPAASEASRAESAGAPVAPSESVAIRDLGAGLPSRTVSHANTATRGGESSRVGVAGGSGGKSAAAPVMQRQAPQASPGMSRGAMRAGNGGSTSSASASGGDVGSGSGGGAGAAATNSADQTVTVTEAAPPPNAAESSKLMQEKNAEEDAAKSDAAVSIEAEAAPPSNARKARSSATTSAAGKAGAAAPAPSAKAMNLAASQTTEAAALAKLQEAQISSNLMNLQIATPDPKVLWMIAGPGAIERSENGGASWKTEYPDTRALIVAGAAPTAKICWLVGANGTILRTTNGSHWNTISAPAETDFVGVEAADALTATVTAMDGRKFATSDGGKSWSSVK
jgi:hypothetical protein